MERKREGHKTLLKVLEDWRHQSDLEPPDVHCQRSIKDLHRPRIRATEQVFLLPFPSFSIAES